MGWDNAEAFEWASPLLAGVSAIALGGASPLHAQHGDVGRPSAGPVAESADKSRRNLKITPTVTHTSVQRATVGHASDARIACRSHSDRARGQAANELAKRTAANEPDKRVEAKDKTERQRKQEKGRQGRRPPAVPSGPLHVIVSVDEQRASLYANGTFVASTKVSTGTKSHPTPMGVFSVIQKNRHHVSNLYGAPMPYMQRLTWSGTAMHTGPLPGYPASHGCIRLTDDFAQMLWKATKIGARVIVTREDVKPVEFAHARLFVPRPQVAALPPAAKPLKPAARWCAPPTPPAQ